MVNTNLIYGDCFESMLEFEEASFDCILTDPPYGMDLTPQRDSGKFKGVKIANDNTLTWTDSFFQECFRVVKNNTGSFFFCSHHCIAEHPTQKPVDLLRHLLEEPDYNPANVLDPFMGSGSTGVACAEMGINFTGIELDLGYFRTARRRIKEACNAENT